LSFGSNEKDPVDEMKSLRKAADQGDVEAQYSLGVCYIKGKGVGRNLSEAIEWFSKAAEQGHAKAQTYLGMSNLSGVGVKTNPVEAVKWLNKASEQGETIAQMALAGCYADGNGITQNLIEAYKWAAIALAGDFFLSEGTADGFKIAKECSALLEKQMTSEQIAQAKQMAANFKPRSTANNSTFKP